MAEYYCPQCDGEIDAESINIREGVALCERCAQLIRLGELVDFDRPAGEVFDRPPRGCSIREQGPLIVVQASARSLGKLLGMSLICVFWNGIVSIFVLAAVAGIYEQLVGPLPDWFPTMEADDGGAMSLGESVFLCIFLIPFVTIGAFFLAGLLFVAVGRVRVAIGQDQAVVSTGVGPLAWRKRFDPKQVRRVTIGKTAWETNGSRDDLVEIVADRKVKFGSLLPEGRVEWMVAVLHALLVTPDSPRAEQIRRLAQGATFRVPNDM